MLPSTQPEVEVLFANRTDKFGARAVKERALVDLFAGAAQTLHDLTFSKHNDLGFE